MKITKFKSLACLTTLQVGGEAEYFSEPSSIEDIKELIIWSKKKNINVHIIGAGSNLLINNGLIKGLTICIKNIKGINCNKISGIVTAACGEKTPNVARLAAKDGLKGFEWAIGIPGTIGGAVTMNAGAQGSSIKNFLISAAIFDCKSCEIHELSNKELNFDYRQSLIQESKQLIVLSATFQFKPNQNKRELINLTNENLKLRTKSQPYDQPSCGSIFKNPANQNAGKIIDELGLKGFSIGGAEISKIHGNFIVNSNEATAQDIQKLIRIIKEQVKTKKGLTLLTEVKMLGF